MSSLVGELTEILTTSVDGVSLSVVSGCCCCVVSDSLSSVLFGWPVDEVMRSFSSLHNLL